MIYAPEKKRHENGTGKKTQNRENKTDSEKGIPSRLIIRQEKPNRRKKERIKMLKNLCDSCRLGVVVVVGGGGGVLLRVLAA